MDAGTFWEVLSDGSLERVVRALARRPLAEIVGFELMLREQLRRADRNTLMGAMKILVGSVTDDSWLYFRCALICEGQLVFEHALADPDSLATHAWYRPLEREELLYVADKAHLLASKKRTGTPARDAAEARRSRYDGSDCGPDWTESELPKLLPKLWRLKRLRSAPP